MFNVTIIKLKDIVKIGIILILIYVFSNFFIKNFKLSINSLKFDSINFIKKGIGQQSNIIKNISNEKNIQTDEKIIETERNKELLEISSILEQGANIFSLEVNENEDILEEKTVAENNIKNVELEKTETTEKKDFIIDSKLATEVVTSQPLADRYDREYNGVKIKNETEFDLTDDILNPNDLDINTSNILIFHTHTCESYTQSENYSYEPTRNI